MEKYGGISMSKWTKEQCIAALQDKAQETGRFPKKSDFDSSIVNVIKGHLGPWPRALEAAGVKPVDPTRLQRKQEKRLRARQNQKRYRLEHPRPGLAKCEESLDTPRKEGNIEENNQKNT